MRRLVLLFAFAAVAISCGGSTTSPSSSTPTMFMLSGQVTDSATGKAVAGANVSVADGPNAGKSSTSDALGSYSFPALQQSGFTVTVSTATYLSASKAVTLTSSQTVPFQLVRSALIFQGVWAGPWVRQSCSETGSFVGFCALFNGGTITLGLTQNGTTAQGTLSLGIFQMNVSGPIGTSGTLTLTGEGAGPGGAILTLTNWQAQISGNRMTGAFTWTIVSPANTPPGTATVTATLEGVARIT